MTLPLERHLLDMQKIMLNLVAFVAPKVSFACLFIILTVWQVPDPGPQWKDLALWSMGIVSTIAIAGFSYFVSEMRAMKRIQKRRHNANVIAMVAIAEAVRTGKEIQLNLKELLEPDE